MIPLTKICGKCKRELPASAFNRYKDKYLQSSCKECHCEEVKTDYWRNPEKYRQKEKHFRATHKDVIKARNRNWYSANAEKAVAYARDRRANRTEKQRKEFNKYWNDYCKRNPAYAQARWNRREARSRNAPGSFTQAEWEELVARYDHHCLRCGLQFTKLTVDHVVPLTKKGTNFIANIQPLCKPCNGKKGDRIIDYRPLWNQAETPVNSASA